MTADEQSRVLVVEDDVGTAEAIRAILQDEGYAVEVATDGRQALERVGETRPDVVLMDLMMPVMDGWQACQALQAQEQTRRIPVIVMTVSQQYLPDIGVPHAGVLAKPFELEEILVAVADAVKRGRRPDLC
jgi:CheY-like chemotaxis protein